LVSDQRILKDLERKEWHAFVVILVNPCRNSLQDQIEVDLVLSLVVGVEHKVLQESINNLYLLFRSLFFTLFLFAVMSHRFVLLHLFYVFSHTRDKIKFKFFALLDLSLSFLELIEPKMDVAHKFLGEKWSKDLLDISLLGSGHLFFSLLSFRWWSVKVFRIFILLVYRPEPFPGLQYK